MVAKWAGTKLVYSDSDHNPNAPDDYGWVYSAAIEKDGDLTRTVARIAMPVIDDTKRLVERLRSGLNHSVSIAVEVDHAVCGDCGQDVSIQTGRCVEHTRALTRMVNGGHPIHVALVGAPGCRNASIRATSESLRVVETTERKENELPDNAAILIEDGRKARAPIISEAVKYTRLNNPDADRTVLTERFDKWTVDEIGMYAEAQKTAFLKRNPDANKQLSDGANESYADAPIAELTSVRKPGPRLTNEDIIKLIREEK